jgi:hypothetical protein
MDMSRMIFVTGFARGGTTWLRNCIGTHPKISRISSELVLFRDHVSDRSAMERIVEQKITDQNLQSDLFVEKSPANAPFVDKAVKALPESKFVFIIRDPRDVFISHKRGTKEWMGGANSTVDGCMKKIRHYYEGFERAQGARNLLLVRYEELHQDFHATMKRIFEFAGVAATPDILDACYEQNNFWTVASRHVERRDEAERKGVVGDWVTFLEDAEAAWFQKNSFWSAFMDRYGYTWAPVSYPRMFQAMAAAGATAMSENDLLNKRLDSAHLNVLLCHDIDSLRLKYSYESILHGAREQARLKMPSMYFFLPMDDSRYAGVKPAKIIEFIRQLQSIHPAAGIGLHLNAAERYFPAGMDDAGDEHPDMTKAIAYLHAQVDLYEQHGIKFRVATAHGYGRRKKKPNNRDSQVFTDELQKRGIAMWDTVLRPQVFEIASHVAHIADVGGAISARDMPTPGDLADSETYRAFPPGSLVHFLIHPGNYDLRKPSTLGRRNNIQVKRLASSGIAASRT